MNLDRYNGTGPTYTTRNQMTVKYSHLATHPYIPATLPGCVVVVAAAAAEYYLSALVLR